MRLPRKAALFTAIAAESIGQCDIDDAPQRAASLWLSASLLYSRMGNGRGDTGQYAWATLRASILHALCQQVDHVSGEQAAELLLVLLSEISPDLIHHSTSNYTGNSHYSRHGDDESLPSESYHPTIHDDESLTHPTYDTISDLDSVSRAKPRTGTKSTQSSVTSATMSSRSAFFPISGPSLTMAQNKWFEDPPLPSLLLPLV
eukprot:CAMPEP_0172511092 /NCGR_PEP_ID=MMETSP1066-20121228/233761_1 /TAXON_ID=671091 /ORGANISM="Coscinodiscus wailesii, Strain CCMP2513" /LENGTH=202 /DNA_ID=CAMNT_0013290331 /DNA_START=1 /DNA_END=605 /DNA_ORIENTATION=-